MTKARLSGRLRTVLIGAAATVAAGLSAAPAPAATRLVDDDGKQCPNAQYQTIQAAVDAAAASQGDVVVVCDGRYTEDPDVERSFAGADVRVALTIRSRRPRGAVVEGRWNLCSFDGAAVVRGFLLEGDVHTTCGLATIEDNLVRGGTLSGSNARTTIRRNTLVGYEDVGIVAFGSNFGGGGSATIVRNRLEGAPGAVGILVEEGSPRCFGASFARVEYNTVTGNDVGLLTEECVGAYFVGNRVTGNVTGARVGEAAEVVRNVITGNSGDGLVVEFAPDYGRVVRNDLRGNGGTDCVLLDGDRPASWHSNLGLDSSPSGLCSPNGK